MVEVDDAIRKEDWDKIHETGYRAGYERGKAEAESERAILNSELHLIVSDRTRLAIILDRVASRFRMFAENYGGYSFAEKLVADAISGDSET